MRKIRHIHHSNKCVLGIVLPIVVHINQVIMHSKRIKNNKVKWEEVYYFLLIRSNIERAIFQAQIHISQSILAVEQYRFI